ncbi:MAG: SDR family oxidoreductase [Alphaproteobacteria bacterium]|nr:SDR family oxidoreductase [Alphaproteobacteria bacterium]MBV9693575.1 SDR family oxidoreductase [Alphaproteobacteria bacterium]
MQGKTVVITGATSGIGEVAAVALARQGARILAVGRDSKRAESTLAKLRAANPDAQHAAPLADLSRLAEMKRISAEITRLAPEIDVLVNNAGALFNTRQVTEDGLEKTFALNHMSYFVVTGLLLPHIKRGGRIVSTASDAHRGARLDFDDLQCERRYSGFSVYGKSKLCNILFTRELARRIQGSGVSANCLHPGFVATRFGDQSGGLVSVAVRLVKPVGAISPEEGAKTIVHLAASPEVEGESGGYYYKCKPATPTPEAQNDADAKRLWDISTRLAGLGA